MTLTYVARAFGATNSGDNFTTMQVSIPASRQIGDLMLVGVTSHSDDVGLPSGFSLLHSPQGGFKLGYRISTAAGGGIITATSDGGAHGMTWLGLWRGFDPAVHDIDADGIHYPGSGPSDNNAVLPAIPVSGTTDSLQLVTVSVRSNATRTLQNASSFTGRWNQTDANWPSTLYERETTTPESATFLLGEGAGEAAGWNIYIYEPKRPAMSVGFLRLG